MRGITIQDLTTSSLGASTGKSLISFLPLCVLVTLWAVWIPLQANSLISGILKVGWFSQSRLSHGTHVGSQSIGGSPTTRPYNGMRRTANTLVLIASTSSGEREQESWQNQLSEELEQQTTNKKESTQFIYLPTLSP